MLPPSHSNRLPEDIVSNKLYFDAMGYLYRAMSWLDYFERNKQFPALLYTCIEARYGIEYLIFEEIVISSGLNLSQVDYEKLLNNSTKLHKFLKQISPDYEKLQQFTKIVASLAPQAPKLIQWNLNSLMKSWGTISNYVHWCGSKNTTTELSDWKTNAAKIIKEIIEPIWLNITSGQSGILHPTQMKPEILALWKEYKNGNINDESVRIRANLLKPMLENKYA